MGDNQLELIEQRLRQGGVNGAPDSLRARTLAQVDRELRAARWDRWLGRFAAILLLAGVGLNVTIGMRGPARKRFELSRQETQESLVRTAAAIANVTDAETGSRFVQQMAVLNGWTLDAEQSAAINAAIKELNPRHL